MRGDLLREAIVRPFSFLALSLAICGCTATLQHGMVDVPIVLGDRLHVGAEARFRCAELIELYHVRNSVYVETVLMGTGNSSAVDDVWEIAGAVAATPGHRAIRGVRIQGHSWTMATPFGGLGNASLTADGETVRILEPLPPDCDEAR